MNKLCRILCCVFCVVLLCCNATNVLIVNGASANTITTTISKVEPKAKGFKVTWKKKNKIKGYQIQYSTTSNFKKSESETKTIIKAKTTSATVGKLKGCNKKYYVRVRTYKVIKNKKAYSSWSKGKSVTTLNHKYSAATCTKAKNCKYCGKTSGKSLGHKWIGATCTMPKTCAHCNKTSGKALGHKWKEATFTKPKTCTVCYVTVGKPLDPVIVPGDKTAPELVSLTIDKNKVRVGDVITFTAVINDESTIDCAEFQFKCGADWHNVFLENVGGNTYVGTLKITDSFINGTYCISWIYLNDYADNSSAPNSDVSFTVENPDSDIVIAQGDKTAPELVSFNLDKTYVKVGDVITFTAIIYDESTIDYAEFQFKCGADWHNVFLENVGGKNYKGTLRITDDFVNGSYSISWISIQDYAGNTASPYGDISFTVENPDSDIVIAQGDKTAPELVSFNLDKTNVKVGDLITFTAVINDESTIDCAEFQFKCGADWHNVFLENVGENTYVGTLKITDSFVNGTYRISWIYLNDYADNSSAPNSDVSFVVAK